MQILAACSSEAGLADREAEQLGVHHGEIGTWLADQWQLDSPFADGILFHHLPAEQIVTAAQLPQFVWLAHALVSCDEIPDELAAVADKMFASAGSRLTSLRDEAEQRMTMIADAIGITHPERAAGESLLGLPRILAAHRRSGDGDADGQIAALIGNKALMQPLQEGLGTLESNAEVLLSLRESARILFGLNQLAFLLCDPLDGRLTGNGVGGQPAIFAQVSILCEPQRSLAAAAAARGEICSSYDRLPPPAKSLMDIQFARAFSSAGILCIPMTGRSRTIGVIVAGLSAGQHDRLTRSLPCLANFGRVAGVTLESWREAQDIRRQAEEEASARFSRHARRAVHEAGNPLTIIKGYLRILAGKMPPGAGVHNELAVLGEEIDRVAGIVRRMSALPEGESEDQTIDVCELVRELLVLYRETLFDSRGITIETVLPTRAVRTTSDRNSIKQIILNLWKNASEALSRGERLKLSLTDDILHQGRHFCELRMEDNGPGMSEAVMSALHRSADDQLGARRGVGLSIVGALARRLEAPVSCRSKAGHGTMISLLLPTQDRAEPRDKNEAKPS